MRTRLNLGAYPDSVESVKGAKKKKVMKTAKIFVDREGLYDRNIVFEIIKVTSDEQGNILAAEFVPF